MSADETSPAEPTLVTSTSSEDIIHLYEGPTILTLTMVASPDRTPALCGTLNLHVAIEGRRLEASLAATKVGCRLDHVSCPPSGANLLASRRRRNVVVPARSYLGYVRCAVSHDATPQPLWM